MSEKFSLVLDADERVEVLVALKNQIEIQSSYGSDTIALRGVYERLKEARSVATASSMGSVRSPKKAANARANGKLGGRPRKCPECGTAMKKQTVSEQTVWVCGGCDSVFELEVK